MKSASTEEAVPSEPWLIYDGECPFCSAYVKMLRLRESVGPLRLVNARDGGAELAEIRAAGLDVDEGMVLKLNGRLHHGDDCIHALALMTTPSGAFNRMSAWVFRSDRRSRMLYPWLRRGRNTALSLLGRQRIGTARQDAALAELSGDR